MTDKFLTEQELNDLPIGSLICDDEGDFFRKHDQDRWRWLKFPNDTTTVWRDREMIGSILVPNQHHNVSKSELIDMLLDLNTSSDRSRMIRDIIERFDLPVPTKKITMTVEVEVDRKYEETDPEGIVRLALNDPDAVIIVTETNE